MIRYNHRLVERKWRKAWVADSTFFSEYSRACTYLFPKEQAELDLENARLLVLTDFFATWSTGLKPKITWVHGQSTWLDLVEQLGIWVEPNISQGDNYDLSIVPRGLTASQGSFLCGRLHNGMRLSELLPDFGGDALRVYFLYQGPPERDYNFRWDGLVSAFRFVERVWQGAQKVQGVQLQLGERKEALEELRFTVSRRIEEKKPHTALSAVMEFLNTRTMLTKDEVVGVATLLKTYTPFLSAELLDFMATVEENDCRE